MIVVVVVVLSCSNIGALFTSDQVPFLYRTTSELLLVVEQTSKKAHTFYGHNKKTSISLCTAP